MINIIRTNSKNTDFRGLIFELDAYLKITDGDDHEFYNQFNTLEKIKNGSKMLKNLLGVC